jgi:hypothetical protein
MLPNSWSACQESLFLHIKSRALVCTIVYLGPGDLPTWQPNPNLYVVLEVERAVVFYARLFPS